jgi:hypothetical protein
MCSPDLWIVSNYYDGSVRLLAKNSVGDYLLPKDRDVEKVAFALDPVEINKVLDGTMEQSWCTCPSGIGHGRCQHKFTFDDIRNLRGDWHCNLDPVGTAVHVLKLMPENHYHESKLERRVTYYLLDKKVCRGFYSKCLGLSKKIVDKISCLVRGKEFVKPIRNKLPGYPPTTKYDETVGFWDDYLINFAQTSGDGNRYFPANMSCYYIYNNEFWPWWQVYKKLWQDDPEPPFGSDPDLFNALLPKDVPTSIEDVNAIFREALHQTRNSVEDEQKDADETHARHAGDYELTPEMESVLAARPDLINDIIDEAQTQKDLKFLQREAGFPSYATFMRALCDPKFANLKKRDKHFHCRCPTCAELTTKLRRAGKSSEARQEYLKQLKEHHFEVRRWRTFEHELQLQARNAPASVTVLSYDDTSPIGFPKMTKKPIKNMPNDKVYMIPFNLVNHGTGESIYMYTMKGRWKKGADRLCTALYHTIRRLKFKPDETCSPAEKAQKLSRKLVLMGDNYSENKNNVLFAFCTELVQRGWYSEFELVFGPVGHTHNGNDAVHFIHNQIAGNFESITPCELFNNYSYAWRDDRNRPQPIIVDCQYAWKERYRPYLNRVSGFTNKGIRQPAYVRAFRITKNDDNIIEMHVRGSPTSGEWCGVNSVPNTPGFQMLKGVPASYPLPKHPIPHHLKQAYMKGLQSDKMKKYCEDLGRGIMHANLIRMAQTMEVPSLGLATPAELDTLPATRKKTIFGWGEIHKIGEVNCQTYLVPFIKPRPLFQCEKSFWALPNQDGALGVAPPMSRQMSQHIPDVTTPIVRYTGREPTKRRAPARPKKKSKRKARESSESEEKEEVLLSSDDDDGDDGRSRRGKGKRQRHDDIKDSGVVSQAHRQPRISDIGTAEGVSSAVGDVSGAAGDVPGAAGGSEVLEDDVDVRDELENAFEDDVEDDDDVPLTQLFESEIQIPESWGCRLEDIKVGQFVVMEADYESVNKRGICVSQVY